MPTLVALTYPALADEPVSLAQLKAQVRVDGTAEDGLLGLKLQAARDLCEQYCGRFFAPCNVAATYDVGEAYELDPLAGTPTAVRGYYTDLADLTRLADTAYQAEYLKGITVSRDYPVSGTGYGYGAGRNGPATFTVSYPIACDATKVPPAVKEAILKLAAELYEARETSATGQSAGRDKLLAVSYRTLLDPYRRTNPFYSS